MAVCGVGSGDGDGGWGWDRFDELLEGVRAVTWVLEHATTTACVGGGERARMVRLGDEGLEELEERMGDLRGLWCRLVKEGVTRE